MNKKLSQAFVLLLVFTLVLSACSSGGTGSFGGVESSGIEAKSEGDGEKTTIRLATWAGAEEAKELQAILDEMNAKSDTYEIVQDSNPAEYDTRLLTQLSGESGPDLFWVSAQRAAQLSARGAMLDITDRLSSSDHLAGDLSDYYPSSLEPFKVGEKIYGLPWLQQPVMLYVNKDLFDKAGIKYPDDSWTWETFMDAARKLTVDQNGKHPGEEGFDANNIKQWGFTINGWPPVQMFIWQNGGEVISPDFSSSPIDTPEAMEAFKFYSELINSPVTPSQQTIRDRGFDAMYKKQEVAMFMGGAADSLDWDVDFNSQAFPVPAGPDGKRVTFTDILGMGINAKTKHPDAAFEALLDLTDAIHHWKIMPPRKSLAELETLKELQPKKAHSLQAIIDSMEFGIAYRYFENYPDWDNIFWTQLMDPIVNAGADPEKLVPKVKPQLDEVLRNYTRK